MKDITIKIICIISFICLLISCGTTDYLKQAEQENDLSNYSVAIELYEKGLEKGMNTKAASRLAYLYYKNGNTERSEHWYSQVVRQPNVPKEDFYYYANVLLSNGKVSDAKGWAQKYYEENPSDPRALALLEGIRNSNDLYENADLTSVNRLDFNTTNAGEFSPFLLDGVLYFTSDRAGSGKTAASTGRDYSQLYQVPASGGMPKPLGGNVNGKYNDAAASFTDDGEVMYFTRNNYSGRKVKKDGNDVVNLGIHEARKDGTNWNISNDFPFNSDNVSHLHAAISPNGKMLVYASDRAGGKGKLDLYFSEKQGNSWSEPRSLGNRINTAGVEYFPQFLDENSISFSSDGLGGLGGIDIFTSKLENGKWSAPENIGAPINSPKDDLGLYSRDGIKTGYFTTNRDGTEDIYSFERKSPPRKLSLSGIVVDEMTRIPLPDTKVELMNLTTGASFNYTTGKNGRFEFLLEENQNYKIIGQRGEVATTSAEIETFSDDTPENTFVELLYQDLRFILNGEALNSTTGQGVAGVSVELFNIKTSKKETAITDENGAFSFLLEQDTDYQISGEKDDYYTTVQEASTMGLNRSTTLFVKLYLSIQEVIIGETFVLEEGVKIGDFELNNIYYDLDKYYIRPDAALVLEELANFLETNSSISIELSSHTDSRGKDAYNKRLSLQRAEAAVEFLVNRGIAANRLEAAGFGEIQLVNSCGNGKRCTEEEHQENRRTEVKILNK